LVLSQTASLCLLYKSALNHLTANDYRFGALSKAQAIALQANLRFIGHKIAGLNSQSAP